VPLSTGVIPPGLRGGPLLGIPFGSPTRVSFKRGGFGNAFKTPGFFGEGFGL